MIVMLAEVSHSNSLDFIFQSTPHTHSLIYFRFGISCEQQVCFWVMAVGTCPISSQTNSTDMEKSDTWKAAQFNVHLM